ncbi:MAG TPA: class I SAM-dependent methyltransferase [Ktedonobacterales bacterium]|nr:class I SAM-dependent methyltransferase [Ktedonobacterales bacterium]
MGLFNWFRRSSQDQRESGDNSMRWSWFGGRRILRFGSYIFPKDAAEGDRLDLQHHLLKLSLGGNYRAPVRQPRAILDVACGTGIWCRELAQEFPNAQVTGFDIDSTPMDSSRKRLGPSGQFPANFHFLEANALKPFPFEDASFDFTHARLLAGFLPIKQWPAVLAEMARVTRPGGYIELVENELPISPSPAFNFLVGVSLQMLRKYGLYEGAGPHLIEHLRQAGLERVQQRRVVLGTGRFASRQQRLMITDLVAGAENFQPVAIRAGLVEEDKYSAALAQDRDELTKMGVTWAYTCAYGMKPLARK